MTQHKQKKATTKKAGTPRKATTTARRTAKGPARKKAPKPEKAAPETRPPRERDPRLPAPGTTLTRNYKGREHRLKVLTEGFEYEGETFRSLTAAAKRATGYPSISGTDWWGVTKRESKTAPRAAKRKGKAPTPEAPAAGTTPAAEAPTA